MAGAICIQEKPEVKPLGPSRLDSMVPYKVVAVRENFTEAAVGDIVLRFPSGNGNGVFVLNCTRQSMFWDKSTDRSWDTAFTCL